jgi:hypothetical protein
MTALQEAIQIVRDYELEAYHGSHHGYGVIEINKVIPILENMEIRLRNECEAEKAMQTLKEQY